MGNPAFNVIVVLFWLATMSWLVVAKIVPPLRVGEPPNYASIVHDSPEEPPTCWAIRMQGQTIGWAVNGLERRKEGVSEFYSRVYLDKLPLAELAPGWLTTVLRPIFPDLDLVDVHKQSKLVVDPLGRLSEFESRVQLAGIPDAIKVSGQVEGSSLKLTVKSGEATVGATHSIAANSLLNDELSPQARMPNLRVGQTWTVPLYSPFRAPHSPLDVLQASVDREDTCRWDGRDVLARLVVYRGDAGSGRASDAIRGRMWVRQDGVVLRQEVTGFRSPVQFERLPDSQARLLREILPEGWSRPLPSQLAREALAALRAGGVSPEIEQPAP
jgi:hypothetical protein